MDGEEPLGVLHGALELLDRDGRGVGADDGVGAGVLGDLPEHLALDIDPLEHGFLDEVDVGDSFFDGLAGGDVLRDEIGGAGSVQALLLEVAGFLLEALEGLVGDLDVDIGDGHVEAGHGEDLGDATAHVASADDGHGGNGHLGGLLRLYGTRPQRATPMTTPLLGVRRESARSSRALNNTDPIGYRRTRM